MFIVHVVMCISAINNVATTTMASMMPMSMSPTAAAAGMTGSTGMGGGMTGTGNGGGTTSTGNGGTTGTDDGGGTGGGATGGGATGAGDTGAGADTDGGGDTEGGSDTNGTGDTAAEGDTGAGGDTDNGDATGGDENNNGGDADTGGGADMNGGDADAGMTSNGGDDPGTGDGTTGGTAGGTAVDDPIADDAGGADDEVTDMFQFRLKRDIPTLVNANNYYINELARRVLIAIETAMIANDDQGACLKKNLCETNKWSRSLEGRQKIIMPVFSLGLSWISGRLIKTVSSATSRLDALKAAVLGLGKANCEIIYQECDLRREVFKRRLRRRRRQTK
ncbi:unnamed protein product [Acanthoscelides obtectus]|nr:unnamed protein product [Acanthoscelides obtectus]CAK1672314.1 hypothetical protein AOBTE_LOCUS28777 [Acanthoscelides obtectus]